MPNPLSKGFGARLGGTAIVTCVHGKIKRDSTEAEFDALTEEPIICICCENLFIALKTQERNGTPLCNHCLRKGH